MKIITAKIWLSTIVTGFSFSEMLPVAYQLYVRATINCAWLNYGANLAYTLYNTLFIMVAARIMKYNLTNNILLC
jgi:hypothetical protein